jgi:CheY-like chemotaxis protein
MKMNNILLVSNDAGFLYLLGLTLESRGLNVTRATTGVEAVEILKVNFFGMMITDFNMPGMDGIELAIAAKNMQPAIQIIMISADLSPDIIETAANADISKIVSKPVNVMKLFAIIRSALRLR